VRGERGEEREERRERRERREEREKREGEGSEKEVTGDMWEVEREWRIIFISFLSIYLFSTQAQT